jgi:hypothetical protein
MAEMAELRYGKICPRPLLEGENKRSGSLLGEKDWGGDKSSLHSATPIIRESEAWPLPIKHCLQTRSIYLPLTQLGFL